METIRVPQRVKLKVFTFQSVLDFLTSNMTFEELNGVYTSVERYVFGVRLLLCSNIPVCILFDEARAHFRDIYIKT